MVGFVGAAVDYSHANAVRTAMQAAADSTALMLSKESPSTQPSIQPRKANDYFKALFTRADATGLTISATYSTSDRLAGDRQRVGHRAGRLHEA